MALTTVRSAPSVSRGGKKVNAYEVVTERICGLLEKGTIPWRRRWRGGERIPQNLVSHRPYRGMNPFILECMGYDSPFWLSFKQAKERGGSVKKGEKGSPVVFWKWLDVDDKETGRKKKIPLLRYFSVFNVEQTDGVEWTDPSAPEKAEHQRIQEAEAIVSGYAKGPTIRHRVGVPCYRPSTDEVLVPELGHYESPESYYSTLFHELGHSTGHESRLSRKFGTGFGSHVYSREELVAEFTASFLGSEAGILESNVELSAAYIGTWLERLRENPRWIPEAAAAAQKAADLILGRVAEGAQS